MTYDPLLDPLRRELTQQTLRYAAGRAIFCPSCKTVLDAPNTVLVTSKTAGAGVACGPCFDRQIAQAEAKGITLAQLVEDGLEVDDGRLVFPKPQAEGQGSLL